MPQIFSPTIIAIILTGITEGPDAVKRLLRKLIHWRVGLSWYVAAFSLFRVPMLYAPGYLALGNPARGMPAGMTPSLLLYYLVFNLYSGPLAEETGWRGYALPRLQKDFSAFNSSLILGVIWAFWHLPFYATSGGGVGIPFPAYIALVVVVTIFLTWMYNNTGSTLLCVLAHFSFNACSAFIPGHLGLMPAMLFYIGCSVGLVAIVAAIVVYSGPKHLSRKPGNSA